MARKTDYVTCNNCTHTENIHDEFVCNAYLCNCNNFR